MQVIISDYFLVHVRMNIYLLYVHWSHSLMTALFDQVFVCMISIVYILDHTILALVHTLCSTCHKLNESFVCVRVCSGYRNKCVSASQFLD